MGRKHHDAGYSCYLSCLSVPAGNSAAVSALVQCIAMETVTSSVDVFLSAQTASGCHKLDMYSILMLLSVSVTGFC